MLNRDQQLVQDYLQAGVLLYNTLPYEAEHSLRQCLLSLDGAIASFGRCELSVRQSARENVSLEINNNTGLTPIAQHYNEAGLNSLSDSTFFLAKFRQELESRSNESKGRVDRRKLESKLVAYREAVRLELSNIELKPKDIEEICEQLDFAIESARSGDPLKLIDFIDEKINELDEVRRSEDRGTLTNLAWWKIVAVAAFFGITIWALIKCVWRWFGWSCTPMEALVYVLIGKAAALGYYLC